MMWGNYCLKEIQVVVKEIMDFDEVVRNEPLVLLQRVET